MYVEPVLQLNINGNSRRILHKSQGRLFKSSVHWSDGFKIVIWRGWAAGAAAKSNSGGLSGLNPLRSDCSCDDQAGRLDCTSGGQKTHKYKLNLKGDYQSRVHTSQMVLLVVRQGGWARLRKRWPKTLQGELENDCGKPRDLLKTGIMTSWNSQLTFSAHVEERRCWWWCWWWWWGKNRCATEPCDSNPWY